MAEMDEIRKELERLDAIIEKSFEPIRHRRGKVITFAGTIAIWDIRAKLIEAIRRGHSKTLFIQGLCDKYGIDMPPPTVQKIPAKNPATTST